MAEDDRLGFEVQGVFYPHVMVDDYLLDSWALARRMMYPAPLEDWVNRKCDPMLYLSVYAAVDVYHARREDLSIDKVLELALERQPVPLTEEEIAAAEAVVAAWVPVAEAQGSVKH